MLIRDLFATLDGQDALYYLCSRLKSSRKFLFDFVLPCEKLMPDSDRHIFKNSAIMRMMKEEELLRIE